MNNARRSIFKYVMDAASHTGVHFSDENKSQTHSLHLFIAPLSHVGTMGT